MTAGDSPTELKSTDSTGATAAIAFLAMASCAGWLWISRIAQRFVWGDGHAERPTLQLMAALAVLWVIWGGIGWIFSTTKATKSAWLCCAAGLLSQLFFLNSNPILEHDGYRYLWDGAVLDAGVSPYRYAPGEIASANADDISDIHKRTLIQRINTDSDATTTLIRVGYPEIKTIYPPAAQYVFFAAYRIGGWSWSGLRIVFVLAFVGGIYLTGAAVRGGDASPTNLAALMALCPLAIKEIGNSAHVDAMLVLYFGALLFVVSRHASVRPMGLAIAAGAMMALAIATKLYPVIAMPVVAAWCAARYSWRMAVAMVFSTLIFLLLLYTPFLWMGERSFFSALTAFGNSWQRNESVFGVLQWAATKAFGDSPIALAGVPGGTGPLGIVAAKWIANALVLIVCAGCTRHVLLNARERDPVELLSRNFSILFLAWFLLLPMAYPWYLLGVLPFLACARWGPLPWVLIASVSVFYYGDFYIDAFNLPKSAVTLLLRVEYGLPLAAALSVWITRVLRRHEGVGR